MKKFSHIIAIVLLVASVALVVGPAVAYGENTPPSLPQGVTPLDNTQTGQAAASPNGGVPQYTPSANQWRPDIDTPQAKGCSLTNLNACIANLVYLGMSVVSTALWFSGAILDLSLNYTIHLAELVRATKIVDVGWVIFRDLANISFIFILLWVGISTILGIHSGESKKLITGVILVALLINFSLFFTEIIVDASNVVALHFYSLIVSNQKIAAVSSSPTGSSSFQDMIGPPTSSFAGAFMEGLKIQTIYDPKSPDGDPTNSISFINIVLIGIFGSILMLVAAYVFLAAAILFIIRTVVLIFLMMVSPIAFVSYIVPGARHVAEKWWHELVSQCLFAPIYMTIAYVVVEIIQHGGITSLGSGTFRSAILNGSSNASNSSSMGIIIAFIILIGLMVGALIIAKKMGAHGAETLSHWGSDLRKNAQSFVGRNAIRTGFGVGAGLTATGWVGQKILGGERGRKFAERMNNRAKSWDVTEWDRRFGRSRFGQTLIGEKVRQATTKAAVHAKFGGEKSAFETREEDEVRRQKLEEIGYRENVGRKAKELETLKDNKQYVEPPPVRENFKTDDEYNRAVDSYVEAFTPLEKDFKKFGADSERLFKLASEVFEKMKASLPKVPSRKDFVEGEEGDKKFNEAKTEYTGEQMRLMNELRTKKPKEDYTSDDMYKVIEKIHEGGIGALRERKISKVEGELGTSVNLLSPRGFAEMQEEQIHALARYATVKQVQAVLESTEWTMDEKREMLKPRYEWAVEGYRKYQEEEDKFLDKQRELNKAIYDKKVKINRKTRKPLYTRKREVTEPDGTKRMATFALDGKDGKEVVEAPEEPPLPGELREWSRNDMTLPDYEIMASVMPEAFKINALAQVIRWPMVFKDLRKNERLPADLRDDLTYRKDSAFRRLTDPRDPHYLEANTDAERASAYKEARKAAEALRKAGASKEEARDKYYDVISDLLAKDTLRMFALREYMSGRAKDETPRGLYRNSPTYHSAIDAAILGQFDTKDRTDATRAVADLTAAYIKDREGVAEMTEENKRALEWLMTNRQGRQFQQVTMKGEDTAKLGYGTEGEVRIYDENGKETKRVSLDDVFKELRDKYSEGDKMTFASNFTMFGEEPPGEDGDDTGADGTRGRGTGGGGTPTGGGGNGQRITGGGGEGHQPKFTKKY